VSFTQRALANRARARGALSWIHRNLIPTIMTARHPFRLSRLAAALILAALAVPALAQDPPARAGRIAYLAGAVSFSPAGTDQWAQAPLNRPLVAGDRLWTEPGARDEAQFGPAIARMDGATLLGVLADDEGATQLQLSQGRIDLHVRRVNPGETVEIDTPNLAFVARAPGDYRIVVAPDGGSTDVAILRGAGDVYGDGNGYQLGPGQGYRFGGQDLDNLGAVAIQPYDDFDRWAMARDARLDRAQSARFVAADVVGYEDLDDNGAWRVVPDYGTVWVPTRVAAGWAPYHSGHWAWIDPWGWTWIDDQPWGYAVSHYGRWANIDGRWAWVPSPPRERAVYAPALVAFVGAALAWGGSGGDGSGVGWFPLGPREAYRPSYHASPAYVTRVNVSNTAFRPGMLAHDLRDAGALRYANRGVPGALMAMPAAQFAQAAPAGRAGRSLSPQMALRAPLIAAPGTRPLPQSRIGMPPAHGLPPGAAQQRVAVARAMPHGMSHGWTMPGAQPAGPALAQRGAAPGAQAGRAPLRMLRPAPALRPGVPPPHGAAAPRFAGRGGALPAAAPRMDIPHAPASHVNAEAQHMPPHAQPSAPAAHEYAAQQHLQGPPQRHPQLAMERRPQPATQWHPAPAPQPHYEAAPQPHAQAAPPPPHPRPAPPQQRPHPQPAPQPPPQQQHTQAAPPPPHPQPAPPQQHPQPAPPPHPEPAHAPQQHGQGGGHEEGKEHGHGH
jgi:hypothetical protein